MKKIIHCIIISLIFFSHTTFCAQILISSFLKTTEIVSNSEAYEESVDGILWKFSDKYMQDINHDFYKDGISKAIALRSENINCLPTTNTVNLKETSYSSTGLVVSTNAESAELLKPCTTFIITTTSLLVLIIASIILIRIKTNTLKLF
jgi:hypothetical protein